MPLTDDDEEPLFVTDAEESDEDTAARPLVRLDAPRDGVPAVVADNATLLATAQALAGGYGPVAVDAERASGHRYGQRAFLVQLRRAGAGTVLIDPAALPDLGAVGAALQDAEWVLHAANQDLPCLAEVGMRPASVFDTELGSRLAGFSRVGLAAVVEQLLGLSLTKEHSAVDWSVRPLPEPWLRYAALDVEVLIDLRDALATELERQGKLEWAHEEFAAVAAAPPPAPRSDPWRRTSGLHRIRTRRQLAIVRELWTSRDTLARERDVSPGRIIPDLSLVEAALAQPTSQRALSGVSAFTGRGSRRHLNRWYEAIARAMGLPEAQLPPLHLPAEGPPPARIWADRDPDAAARLARSRSALVALATKLSIPVENLISPDTVRRLAWSPPSPADEATIEAFLRDHGVRDWQIGLTLPLLVAAVRG
ncbi:MAG TPA: ribonuclease D [Kineosporiaceae bacterium]